MLKTPRNLTVPLRTYRKRLIKELVHFSWSITKKTSYIPMKHRTHGVFGATEGTGRHTSSHRAQRSPQGRDGAHYGAGCANVSVYRTGAGCLWVVCFFVSGSAGHAWGRVLAH